MADETWLARLLQEVAETHHVVFRITDGVDDDWASGYADWLLNLSELPDLIGARPVRSISCTRSFNSTATTPRTRRMLPGRFTTRNACPFCSRFETRRPATTGKQAATRGRSSYSDRSRIALIRARSLRLARRMAGIMIGASALANPAGSPRLRRVMRVVESPASAQV